MVIPVPVLVPRKERRKQADRRCRHRLELALPALIRPFEARHGRLEEEVRPVANFSRDGLFFTTWLEHYYPEMRLLVTFPYVSGNSVHRIYFGKVVRLERLPKRGLGVAVRFLLMP